MIPLLWARAFGCLAALASAHFVLKRFEPAADISTPIARDPKALAAAVIGICALSLLPVFGSRFSSSGIGSVAGVWALFQVSRLAKPGMTQTESIASFWLVAWALAVAGPLTLFAQSEFEGVAGFQNGLIGQLVPAWGIFFQPQAFFLGVLALVRWTDAVGIASTSLRRVDGVALGVLLITSVIVFLGAWHVPWLADETIHEAMGNRRALIAMIELVTFTLKLCVLWGMILWLKRQPAVLERFKDPIWSSGLAAANLLLTWIVLAGTET